MIKISTIFALGIFIAIMPFTGFPFSVKNALYVISGLLITILSIMIRKELEEVIKHLYTEVVKTDTYSESDPKQTEEVK